MNPLKNIPTFSYRNFTSLYDAKYKATLLAFQKIGMDSQDSFVKAIAQDIANLAVKQALKGCDSSQDQKSDRKHN